MDPLFNLAAARWARDAVLRMDAEAVVPFVTQVTHQLLTEDIAANARTLARHTSEVHKALLIAAARTGADVTEIAKAFGDDEYNRDARGRFATVESRVRTTGSAKPLSSAKAKAQGIPEVSHLKPADRAAYHQQYAQLNQLLDYYTERGAKNPRIIAEHKATGLRREIPVGNGQLPWDPRTHDLRAVRADVPGTGAGNASFDLVSALAGPTAGRYTQAGVQSGPAVGQFADRWSDSSQDVPGSNERTYRRIKSGSQLLGSVAGNPALTGVPGAQQAKIAAEFGTLVGQYGPEAEKVVGPVMRRTSYRYRGIERKPDSALIADRNVRVARMERPVEDQSLASRVAGSTVSPEAKSNASMQAALHYLALRLPNLRLAEIQRLSGRIPPSQGVIIDRDGKIAVQAVGHADDHYLPFNLKNLKALRDGQYVRTRTKGGLTTEDIYTGLVSGARQVTVVSNSGVFTVKFADDFRGVRRYNDKAATMVDRYAKTLDAIKNGQIEREQLSPEIKAQIRDEVVAKMPSNLYSPAQINDAIEAKIKEYKETPQLSGKELDMIRAQAQHGAKNEGDARRAYAQLVEDAMEAKRSRYYQLDGVGYAAALESLKEQYPYYIDSVSFAHRSEAMNAAGERTDENYRGVLPADARDPRKLKPMATGTDSGYVKPRFQRPDAVQEGYFDTEVAGQGEKPGSGKVAASHTGYANWEHNPLRRGKAAEPETKPETKNEEKKPGLNPLPEGSPEDQVARAKRAVGIEAEQKKTAQELLKLGVDAAGHESTTVPTMLEATKDFDSVWDDELKRATLLEELGRTIDAAKAAPAYAAVGHKMEVLQDSLKAMESQLDGRPWDSSLLGKRSKAPYTFSGDAYRPSATPAMYTSEITRQHAPLDALVDKGAPDWTKLTDDSTVADAAAALGKTAVALRAGDYGSMVRKLVEAQNNLGLPENWATQQLTAASNGSVDKEKLAKTYADAAEALERLRALVATHGIPKENFVAAKGEIPKAPARMTTEDAIGRLSNIARQLDSEGESTQADDYREVARLLKAGKHGEARKRAVDLYEDHPVRRHILQSIFGSVDPGPDDAE